MRPATLAPKTAPKKEPTRGSHPATPPPDDYLAIWRTWPSGVASRNLQHWAQLFRDRRLRFSQYDFGGLGGDLLGGGF